jgi:hypothetical protein
VVAVARNPENAAPISGSFIGPNASFLGIEVDVAVIQIDKPEPPPVQNHSSEYQPRIVQSQTQQQAQQSQQGPAPMEMVIHPVSFS